MKLPALLYLPALSLGLGACTTSYPLRPVVAMPREVKRASASPRIRKIVDIGHQRLPRRGRLTQPFSDNLASIGEYLIVWGKGLGKQPSVTIGPEPAEVLRHLSGGGIVVQVPKGVAAGPAKITVRTGRGETSATLTIRRLGLVATAGGLTVFSVGETLRRIGSLPLGTIEGMVMARDGACAYAVVGGEKLVMHTIDLTRSPPVAIGRDVLPGKHLQTLASASASPRSVVVTDTHIVFMDTEIASSPALYHPRPIPRGYLDRPLRGGALSPDGRTLALVASENNELLLFDGTKPAKMPAPKVTELLPNARVPLVLGAAFNLDGKSVWVITGDSAGSIGAGHRPSRAMVFNFAGGAVLGEPKRWQVNEDLAPVSLRMERSTPTPSGSAIRDAHRGSSLYLTLQSPTRLAAKGGAGKNGAAAAVVVRINEGETGKAQLKQPLVGNIALASRPQVIVAEGLKTKGDKQVQVLTLKDAWSDDPATELELSPSKTPATGIWRRPLCVQP